MSNEVIVHKARTNTIYIKMGRDVSGDEFASQIRTKPEVASELIAEWDVSFDSDGTDGLLKLVLSATDSGSITADSGYMDLKRTPIADSDNPVAVFDKPLEVAFIGSVTL